MKTQRQAYKSRARKELQKNQERGGRGKVAWGGQRQCLENRNSLVDASFYSYYSRYFLNNVVC